MKHFRLLTLIQIVADIDYQQSDYTNKQPADCPHNARKA